MTAASVDAGRLEAAVSRIARVQARLNLADAQATQPMFPTERRLLQEAAELLDPEVKLA